MSYTKGVDIMREMASVYYNRSTKDLLRLRSEKHNRLARLRKAWMSYLVQQEIRQLERQIIWIDAVLEARRLQNELPL